MDTSTLQAQRPTRRMPYTEHRVLLLTLCVHVRPPRLEGTRSYLYTSSRPGCMRGAYRAYRFLNVMFFFCDLNFRWQFWTMRSEPSARKKSKQQSTTSAT